ncbi:MAG: TRAP transporter permease, partial [Acidiferrobacterales bacterium]
WYDIVLAALGTGCALYLWLGWDGLVERQGILLTYNMSLFGKGFVLPVEAILGGIGILCLLEATRRGVGVPLVIVASVFLVYSIFGQSMPDLISHKGVSLTRLIGYQWLGGEAIFGIPIDVSVSFVFLFVLFGSLLDKAGAGQYFLNLAFAMVGMLRGGPAKAAILASGMTGLISGSSIANVATTGVFTIPVMKKTGLPAVKAGAIEVAASTNGQMMPPIMGAAAFIIAEFIGISYFDVIVAAFIPAVLSYLGLFYISHLEALKLGLVGLPRVEIPPLRKTFTSGIHFLIPIVILVYLLMVERWTAASAVFYSILALMAIILAQHAIAALRGGSTSIGKGLLSGVVEIYNGLVAGARNMVGVAIAIATAGIIVGAVGSTGLNNAMVGVVEALSGGNVYALLGLTAVLCIILGMGLPTTANYLVVASLLAGVLVELGSAAGLVLPLIAVHLFVFYFGLLADSTPPVCLAAFAASAISRANPLKTGVQSFLYDIRTAILPFVFIFNPELLLVGVESFWYGALIFVVSLIAVFCFGSVTQGWLIVKVKLHEALMLLVVMVALFRPDLVMDQFYPAFKPLDLDKFVAGQVAAKPGFTIRLHVTRSTDYGDRFKLYRIATPELVGADGYELYGVRLDRAEDGRYAVAELQPQGLAEQAGVQLDDYVTKVDVEQVGLPAKQWVYPFALALLGVVIGLQLMRRRRQGSTAVPATTSAE